VGVGGHHTMADVWLGKSPFIQSTGSWVGPRAGLDGAEKEISFAPSVSNPKASSLPGVATPTTLPWHWLVCLHIKYYGLANKV